MSAVRDEVLNGGSLVDSNSLYRPLHRLKHEIRLVRILYDDSDLNEDSHVIRCEMKVFPLHSADTHYVALSYCWTEAEPTNTILVNDIPIWIRTNLHAFMSRMHEEQQQSWIFVDALCVNQASVTERNQQVAAMGNVYRNAAKVIAWLGEPIFESVRIERKVQKACERFVEMEHQIRVQCKRVVQYYLPPSANLKHLWSCNLGKCAEVFLPEQYWSRVWIVQEIVLARSLELRAGGLSLDGATFGTLCLCCKVLSAEGRQVDETDRILRLNLPLQLPNPSARLAIVEAINFTMSRKCSQRHDTVYGVLGLTQKLIKVDYDMPAMELLLKTCVTALLELKATHPSSVLPYWAYAPFRSACRTLIGLPKALSLDHEGSQAFVVMQIAIHLCTDDSIEAPTHRSVTETISSMTEQYLHDPRWSADRSIGGVWSPYVAELLTYSQIKERADAAGPGSDIQKELNGLTTWVCSIFDEITQHFSKMRPQLRSTNEAHLEVLPSPARISARIE